MATKVSKSVLMVEESERIAAAVAAYHNATSEVESNLVNVSDAASRLVHAIDKAQFASTISVPTMNVALRARAWLSENETAVKAERFRRAVREELPRRLNGMVESSQAKLGQFAERFAVNPFDALEWWGTDTFDAAARLRVAQQLLGYLSSDRAAALSDADVAKDLHEHCTGELIRRASNYSRSTSPTSNLAEDSLRVVYAKLSEATRMLAAGEWFFIGSF